MDLIEPTITIAHGSDTMRIRIINIYGFIDFVIDSVPFRPGGYLVNVWKHHSLRDSDNPLLKECVGWRGYVSLDVDWGPVGQEMPDTVNLGEVVFSFSDHGAGMIDDAPCVDVTDRLEGAAGRIIDLYRMSEGCYGMVFYGSVEPVIRFKRGEEEMLIRLLGAGLAPRQIIDSIPFHPGRYTLDLAQGGIEMQGDVDSRCIHLAPLPTVIFRPRRWNRESAWR